MTRWKDLDEEPTARTKLAGTSKKTAGHQPKPKAPSKAAQSTVDPNEAVSGVMQILIADVDEQVALFVGTPSDKQRLMLATVAKRITQRLHWATGEIESIKQTSNPSQPRLLRPRESELARLASAIGTLESMAKSGKLPMAENRLAQMFDSEDRLRSAAGGSILQRADRYYDEAAHATETEARHTPTGKELAAEIEDQGKGPQQKPKTRAAILGEIQTGIPDRLALGFSTGLSLAKRTIQEPPPVANPSALQLIVQNALAFVAQAAFGALGKAIVGSLDSAQIVDGLLATAARSVKDVLAKSMQEMMVKKPRPLGAPKDVSPTKPTAASPMFQFLDRVELATEDAATYAGQAVRAQLPTLQRLPTETLADLYGVLHRGLEDFSHAYAQLLLREWVNFVKAASDAGVINANSSLDNFVEPKGVLRIDMGVKANVVDLHDMSRNTIAGLDVRRVSLPGITPLVRENLASQGYSLQSIPLHRKVVVSLSDQLVPVEFAVTRDYRIEPPKHLSKQQMSLLAKIAGFGPGGTARESYSGAEAMPMLQVVFAHLNTIPASQIQ